jgi:hypothetical protein
MGVGEQKISASMWFCKKSNALEVFPWKVCTNRAASFLPQ